MLSSINISDRWCSDAPNCKFSQKNEFASIYLIQSYKIHDMYFSHICHFRPMTQPNRLKQKFLTHSRPKPTQPNPRVNPTHGQLCQIHVARLYPFVSPVAVYMHPVSATKLSSRRHVSTCIRIQVVWNTCIRLHVSGVNAALGQAPKDLRMANLEQSFSHAGCPTCCLRNCVKGCTESVGYMEWKYWFVSNTCVL